MSDSVEDIKRLGQNIRCLREMYGETREQLAAVISDNIKGTFTGGAIYNYETGIRLPDVSILAVIAQHYLVTQEDLWGKSFQKQAIRIPADSKYSANHFNTYFPIVESEKAMQNDKFRKAYSLQTRFRQALINFAIGQSDSIEEFFPGEADFDDYLGLYTDILSSEECGAEEAAANILSTYFLISTVFQAITDEDNSSTRENSALYNKLKKADPTFGAEIEHIEDSVVEEMREFVQALFTEYDLENLHKDCLKKVYSSSKWHGLCDYYLALQYLYGLKSDVNPILSMNIGLHMMTSLISVGNSYAKDYMASVKNSVNKSD